jgi:hypothetical protein
LPAWPDQTLGNFDMARVGRMLEIVTPIFSAQRKPPNAKLKPEDIATTGRKGQDLRTGSGPPR